MPTRAYRKARATETLIKVTVVPLPVLSLVPKVNNLSEEDVDEIFQKMKNKWTRKMREKIRESENIISKALIFLSENSLVANTADLYADNTSDNDTLILVYYLIYTSDFDQ